MMDDVEKFENDPQIRFDYKYFVDDNPTKFMLGDDISKNKSSYGDNYNYKNEKKRRQKPDLSWVE